MSKILNIFRKKLRKFAEKRIYTEVSICIKDEKTGEILHTYPVHRLYEGDTMEIGPLKFDVDDIEWS